MNFYKINYFMVIKLLLLLSTLFSFPDDFYLFDYQRGFDWSEWEKDTITQEFLLSNIDSILYRPLEYKQNILDNKKSFHFLSINNDSLKDLIYNGWSGGEGEVVTIFKKNNNHFICSQILYGKIVNILRDSTNNLILFVLDYSCCAGYVDHLQVFTYSKEKEEFELKESIANVVETIFPDKWIKPIHFKVKSNNSNLRLSPQIIKLYNYEIGAIESDAFSQENIIAVYKSGDTGTAYAKSTDNTGRVWYFVVMDNLPVKEKSLFYIGNNEFMNYKTIGWISGSSIEFKL